MKGFGLLFEKLVNMKTYELSAKQLQCSLWGISWVSFFWAVSSLMVFAVLPVFLVDVLGASYKQVGILEGVAVSTAFLSKVFSGVLSDLWRRRKPLIVLGTVLTILVKVLYAGATSYGLIFTARFLDRFSKGVRSSPTDALIADLSSNLTHGKSFGLRQALYVLGAVVGAALSMFLMFISDDNCRLVFMLSLIPAIIALVILFGVVKQPVIASEIRLPGERIELKDVRHLPPQFWLILGVSFVLMLARFSESFVMLHGKALGWEAAFLPMIIISMDLVHGGVAYPIGQMADRLPRKELLLAGLLMLVVTNVIFYNAASWEGVLIGTLFNGLHLGMTQGLLHALVAESSPAELRGTAFAMFYLSTGTAILIGNSLAGVLADLYGTSGAFVGGFVFTVIACVLLFLLVRREREPVAV